MRLFALEVLKGHLSVHEVQATLHLLVKADLTYLGQSGAKHVVTSSSISSHFWSISSSPIIHSPQFLVSESSSAIIIS